MSADEPRDVSLADLSDLTVRTRAVERGRTTLALVVAFAGRYRDGSGGNPDARFMRAHLAAALAGFDPCAVVLDLSGLEYRWGDALLGAFQVLDLHLYEPDQPPFPWFLVLGAGCRPAVLSLLGEPPRNERPDLATALADACAASTAWP